LCLVKTERAREKEREREREITLEEVKAQEVKRFGINKK